MNDNICEKHHKELIRKTAVKTARLLLKCADCREAIRQERICEKHKEHYEEWLAVQVNSLKASCEDCKRA